MKRTAFWSAALAVVWLGSARAASTTLELTVSAGKLDRRQVPVSVLLTLPAEMARAKSAVVRDPSGKRLPAQLTAPGLLSPSAGEGGNKETVRREVHFVLPSLAAGKTLTLKATLSTDAPASSDGFSWHDTKGESTELRFGSRPILRYMYKALDESSKDSRNRTYKVFHHLYDPDGKRLVTNGGPTGKYPHHRGLFYGFNKVTYDGKKADVWHCTGDAHQSHEGFVQREAGPVLGRHRVKVDWHGPKKEVFAREERELTVYHVPGGILVEFASRLKSAAGKVHLDGDPQHAGFHFRAADAVSQKKTAKQTYYLRPDGAGKPGATRNWDPKTKKGPVNLPWDAMCFVLGGQRYTVAYLDRPDNPKEARFSERDYGRFGSYFVYDLTRAKPLDVDYRIWLQKGEMKGSQVAALRADFVSPVTVKVK
jgi:hypothetical protein